MPHKDPEKRKAYQREYKRKWYLENKSKERERARRYRDSNVLAVLERDRKQAALRRADNPDRCREIKRKSYAKNIEKRRAEARDKYHKNPGPTKIHAAEWGKNNPQKKSKIIVFQNAKRRARKFCNGGDGVTSSQWKNLIKLFGGACAYCRAVPDVLTIDHFVPLSLGGQDDVVNIVPACIKCNVEKGSKEPIKWLVKRGIIPPEPCQSLG